MSGHRCRNCGELGHRANKCENPATPRHCESCDRVLTARESRYCAKCYRRLMPIGRDGRHVSHCTYCGETGHKITTCPERWK